MFLLFFLEDGGQTEDPDGQRETQQEHHAERKRSQDAGESLKWQTDANMSWLDQIGDVQEDDRGYHANNNRFSFVYFI